MTITNKRKLIIALLTLSLFAPKAYAETYKMKYCEDFSGTGQYVVCQDFEEVRDEQNGIISITSSTQNNAVIAVENQRDIAYANNTWMTRPDEASRIRWTQSADADVSEQRAKVAEQVAARTQQPTQPQGNPNATGAPHTVAKEYCADWSTTGDYIKCMSFEVQYEANGDVVSSGQDTAKDSLMEANSNVYEQNPDMQRPEYLVQWIQRKDDDEKKNREKAAKIIAEEIAEYKRTHPEETLTALGGEKQQEEKIAVTGIDLLDKAIKIPSLDVAEQATSRGFCKMDSWSATVSCIYDATGNKKYEIATEFYAQRPELLAALAKEEPELYTKYATEEDKRMISKIMEDAKALFKAEVDLDKYEKSQTFIMPNGKEYVGSKEQKVQNEKFKTKNTQWRNLVIEQEKKKVEEEEKRAKELAEHNARTSIGVKAIAGIATTVIVLGGASLGKQMRDSMNQEESEENFPSPNTESIYKDNKKRQNKALDNIYVDE